jgi:hypothetical protein
MKRLLLLAAALAIAGCGSSSSPSAPSAPPAPTTAIYSVSVAPNPIIAGAGSQGFQNSAQFTVTVTESAGVSGNVAFVNVTLRNATTGVELNTLQYNPTDITNRASTNHVAAKGTLNIPIGIVYTLSLGGRQATLTVAIQMKDDFGHTDNETVNVNIV